MRKTIVAICAVVLAAFTASARANEATPLSTLLDAARIVQDNKSAQMQYCSKPRTNTTAQCHADFERLYPLTAEYAAWQILHLAAREKGDSEKVAIYEAELARAKKAAVAAGAVLDKHYYPLPAVTQAPPATTGQSKTPDPKVFRAKGKQ